MTDTAGVAAEAQEPAPASDRARLSRTLREAVVAMPPLLVLALVLFWSDQDGGYEPVLWYPGALILLGLLVVVASDRRFSLRLRDRRTLALAAIVAYAAWSALSILWAQAKADAWDGANRTLLYATAFAILACWPTGKRTKALVAALYAVGVAVLGLVTLQRGVHDPSSILVGSRLAMPVGYTNGAAALFLIPIWPALYLGARREVPALARGLLLATAGALLQLALLVQSRGSALAFPIVLVVFVALVPGRARTLLAATAVLAAAAVNLQTLLDVYDAGSHGKAVAPPLAAARDGIAVSIAVLFVAGTLVALLDRRAEVSRQLARRLEWGIVTAFAVAALAGSAAGALSVGHPLGRVENAWHNFRVGTPPDKAASHFISVGGTNRWDFWRVAVRQVGRHPAIGIGVDNFAIDYVRERRSNEEPLYPHSLEVKILLGTGVIGAACFLLFLVFGVAAALRRRRDQFARGVAVAACSGFVYWFVHGSIDWFWELPALTAGALLLLGLAVAPQSSQTDEPPPGSRRRAVGLAVATPVVAAVALSLVFPWLAAREVDLATQKWQSDPSSAYQRLQRARSLNPLSDNADLLAGAIAEHLHDNVRARAAFSRALDRNPASWYANLEVGILDAMQGRKRIALQYLRRAHELDPLEWQVVDADRRVQSGQPVQLQAMDRSFLQRALIYETHAH
ncbi:MAG: O-antigen ligase family protein [Gaiellaceae bacterium]